jgi:hypothetical protein
MKGGGTEEDVEVIIIRFCLLVVVCKECDGGVRCEIGGVNKQGLKTLGDFKLIPGSQF